MHSQNTLPTGCHMFPSLCTELFLLTFIEALRDSSPASTADRKVFAFSQANDATYVRRWNRFFILIFWEAYKPFAGEVCTVLSFLRHCSSDKNRNQNQNHWKKTHRFRLWEITWNLSWTGAERNTFQSINSPLRAYWRIVEGFCFSTFRFRFSTCQLAWDQDCEHF